MFIKELSINSYKNINNLKLNFNKPVINYFDEMNLSVLVGENGTGKSSILQFMTQVFCPRARYQYRQTVENSKFSIEYELMGELIEFNSNTDYPLEHPEKLIVSSYAVFDQFASRYPSASPGNIYFDAPPETTYIYSGPAIARTSTLEPLIYAILQAIYLPEAMVKNKGSYRRLLDRIGFKKVAFIEIAQENKVVRSEYNRMHGLAKEDSVPELDLLIDSLKTMKIDARTLNKDMKLDSLKASLNYIVTPEMLKFHLEDILRKIIYQVMHIGIKNIWLESNDGKYVRLTDLSSGELTMLYRFLPLITNIDDNSVVFIDEPETHLHPVWIQKFVEYLAELFSEYKTHFILATHSPLIVSDVPMECIVGLQKNKNHIFQYEPKDRTLGGSSNDILRDVFGLEKNSGEFSLNQILAIKKLLESNDFEKIESARIMFDDLSTTAKKFEIYKKFRDILGG
ncbi:putative ATP-dependent endonuclease of OLD family [Paenibacillus sp. PastF-3]|uniref:AAA family ATPase n=1 Tax=Paenibacillus sp. PastF-3 TaxID=2940626 RepID=UPI002472E9C3|nr:ATP-binding protein [Paenibacillus sp. PastF-3]MDH6372513.1 putative ATP-dependent endonuclease of OLD family [Paenibacillus sp. PastF-3]